MTYTQLAAAGALSFVVLVAVVLYWTLDHLATGRRPWDGTYFGKAITVNTRGRDWDGD